MTDKITENRHNWLKHDGVNATPIKAEVMLSTVVEEGRVHNVLQNGQQTFNLFIH